MSNAIKQAYELGWRRSAEWSKRDDLLSDIGSPAYKRDRDEDLSHLSAQAKVRVTNFDTTYHGVMVRKMTEMLSNNEWADLFMVDEALEALHAEITRLVAEKNAACLSQGAQGEAVAEMSSDAVCEESDGWLRAVDEEMVNAHLGVANASDSYEDAKKKLNELICWHIDVATDPETNGGMALTDERAAVPDGCRRAMERALPFLDDEASKYEDDGNNEPLDVADTIRDPLAAPQPPEGARVVDEHRIVLGYVWPSSVDYDHIHRLFGDGFSPFHQRVPDGAWPVYAAPTLAGKDISHD